jgi:flavoprotein
MKKNELKEKLGNILDKLGDIEVEMAQHIYHSADSNTILKWFDEVHKVATEANDIYRELP